MTASFSSAPPLFSNPGAYDRPPLSKNNRNHGVKALVKKRGAACLPKEDAEDDISAVMSHLTWMNASAFFSDTSRQNLIYF